MIHLRRLIFTIGLLLSGATLCAQTRVPDAYNPGPGVLASVQNQFFKLSDPVGCVVWTNTRGGNKAFRNQCNFRVEVVACAVGSDRSGSDCADGLKDIKAGMAALDPHPQQVGTYDSEKSVHSAPPFPRVTSVVACPGMAGATDYSHGKPRRIWQIEASGGALTGKCLTPYEGTPPRAKVKTLNWPFYARDYMQDTVNIPVKIVQD